MGKKERKYGISTTGEKVRFAFGDVGYNIMWGFVGSFLTYYYTDSILISAGVVGTIMLLARFLDGASDILMGIIIEKTSSKWGKARPWLLWMIIPLIITFLMVFYIPPFLGGTAKIVYIAVTYTLLSAVTYTASNMAYITLFTLFAPDSNDRNVAATFRTLFAMVTALVIGMVSMPLLEGFGGVASQKSWTTVTLIYAGISFVCVMITFFGVTEKQLSMLIALGSTLIQLVNPYNKTLFMAFYALKGLGGMLFGAAISTLPGDVADWSEWKNGARAEGIVTSLASFGAKVGSGVGAGLVGWILSIGHYDGSAAVQAQSALNAEIMLMIGVPLALAVIQIVLLILWDMDKIRPKMLKELETKRNAVKK